MAMAFILNLRNSICSILKTTHLTLSERSICTTPSLLWFNQRFSRSTKEKEKRYMKIDRVPEHWQLIYRAPMKNYVAWATHVSTATASIITTAATYQYVTNQPILEPLDTKLIMHADDIYYFACGFIAINVLLRLVVSMFPLRIYKDQENILAVYHSQLPMLVTHHTFKKGQVKAVYYRFSPWNNVTYKLGNKTSLLLEDYFKTPSEFHKMQNIEKK